MLGALVAAAALLSAPATGKLPDGDEPKKGGHTSPFAVSLDRELQATGQIAINFRDFGRVLGWNFTRGLFAPENVFPLVLGGAATGLAYTFDEPVSDALRDDEYYWIAGWVGESGNVIGGPALQAATIGTLLLITPFTENKKFRTFTFTLTQAVILDTALKFALKLSISRERPDGSNDNSFPSGHTSSTTAFATVLQHYYGWKWGVPAYAVAGFVALSRIEKGRHYLSDVVFGATVGYIAGFTAIRGTDRSLQPRQLAVYPIVSRGKRGALVVWEF